MRLLRRLYQDESGQDIVEYALLLALLVVVTIVSMRLMGGAIANFFNSINNDLNNVG